MSETTSANGTLEQVEGELRDEHQSLRDLVGRIREASDVAGIAPLLEELHATLHAHFSREEYPGGFYDRLGALKPEYRKQIRDLVDDHYRILARLRALTQLGRTGPPEVAEEVVRDGKAIGDWLADHEKREHALARQAREG